MSMVRAVTTFLLFAVLALSGCMSSSEQDARAVTNAFWQAVLAEDMEATKQLVTWDSARYLHYIRSDQLSAQRFETGELQIKDGMAEVATVLYGGDKGEIKVPLRTVLILHESGWLVDVEKTMGSMVSGAMGSIVEQLNSFMQEGLKGLDESLSESIDQLGDSLQKGLKDLQKELTLPPPSQSPELKPAPEPPQKNQQII